MVLIVYHGELRRELSYEKTGETAGRISPVEKLFTYLGNTVFFDDELSFLLEVADGSLESVFA